MRIDDLINEMNNESLFKKSKRWINVRIWILKCYIFNRKKYHAKYNNITQDIQDKERDR